jgi:hypothetical protein
MGKGSLLLLLNLYGAIAYPQSCPVQEGTCAKLTQEMPNYTFALQDSHLWLQHLSSQGYVVIRQVLSPEEVVVAKDLLWKDFERTSEGLSRDDIETWKDGRFSSTGLNAKVAQGAGAWHVRGSAGLKKAFSDIWETSNLIVSMDAVIAWRPWWIESSWKPETEGLHLDQNPFSKPERDVVQGMVPLLPVTDVTGGLQVVPLSHTEQAKEELKKSEGRYLEVCGDWCPLNERTTDRLEKKLLLAEPGDLILWDARTIHGGVVGTGDVSGVNPDSTELARLAVVVSMVPRDKASPSVQQARVEGFRKGKSFNHSPHEAGTSAGTLWSIPPKNYEPIELSEAQLELL